MKKYSKAALIILDGWGIRERLAYNPTKSANIPNYKNWLENYECTVMDASEGFVGLSDGQMGNSEVGHLNLGAGMIVYQDITLIDKYISEKTFFSMEPLVKCAEDVKSKNAKVHLIGLFSDGGVHSHQNHLHALIDFFTSRNIEPVLHLITDGRDTPPNSAINYLQRLEKYIGSRKVTIASVAGRYYTMDRDKRWERVKPGYEAILNHSGKMFNTPKDAILDSYKNNVTDEFIIPSVIGPADNYNSVDKDDYIVFYNFRADRMRQIVRSLTDSEFTGFDQKFVMDPGNIITFTKYEDSFTVQVLFHHQNVETPLAKVISDNNLKQFHAAETEKYPHVTYFFNGRREEPFPGETRLLVPSPKVATYDLKPEMSAYELTNGILDRLKNFDDNFFMINYANPDMVGHTGIMEAAEKAIEAVDNCAGKVVNEIIKSGGVVLLTSDHGNCELMFDEINNLPHTAHTTNPVRLFALAEERIFMRSRGILADVAPTILDLMGIEKPEEMTGKSLVKK